MSSIKGTNTLIPKETFIDKYIASNPPDLSLIVGGQLFDIHKLILTTYSEVFKSMLSGKFKLDNELNHDPNIFSKLIDILYNKPIEHTFGELIDLINLLDYYQISEPLKELAKILKMKITDGDENVCMAYKKVIHVETKEMCFALLSEHLVDNCDDNDILSQIINEDDIIKCITYHKENVQAEKELEETISDLEDSYASLISNWIDIHQKEKYKEYCQKMTSVIDLNCLSEKMLVTDFDFYIDNEGDGLYFNELDVLRILLKKRREYYGLY